MTDDQITEAFVYHAPDADDIQKHVAIRSKAKELAIVIRDATPRCADQSAALRKLREAVMTANAAIALKGKV